jgi:hypothetical protein
MRRAAGFGSVLPEAASAQMQHNVARLALLPSSGRIPISRSLCEITTHSTHMDHSSGTEPSRCVFEIIRDLGQAEINLMPLSGSIGRVFLERSTVFLRRGLGYGRFIYSASHRYL